MKLDREPLYDTAVTQDIDKTNGKRHSLLGVIVEGRRWGPPGPLGSGTGKRLGWREVLPGTEFPTQFHL